MDNKIIFFAGAGNMAGAIIAGMVNSGAFKPGNIICNDTQPDKAGALGEKYGVSVSCDKKKSVPLADIIVLAVKPQNMPAVLGEIKPFIKKGALIISIAAGITTEFIENSLGAEQAAVRAMPNTPALAGMGTTALCAGKYASDKDLQAASDIFSSVGTAKVLGEDKFDAVTALSGSGPAYIFYLCELMQKAGESLGLDKDTAEEFAVRTVAGAGKMLAENFAGAASLRRAVTSPNGTTQAALEYFDSQNLSEIVRAAMEQAALRSKELSK